MRTAKSLARGLAVALVLGGGSVGLSGCSTGDVEFNGKIFEMVGLAGEGARRTEPVAERRAPLVLPPDPSKLPEPGANAAPIVTGANPEWPKDRDARRMADADARKAAQKKFCEDGNWKEKAHGKDIEAAQGPDGSCHGNIFTYMSKALTGGDSE